MLQDLDGRQVLTEGNAADKTIRLLSDGTDALVSLYDPDGLPLLLPQTWLSNRLTH